MKLLFGLLAASTACAQVICYGGAALDAKIRVTFALYSDGYGSGEHFDFETLCRHEDGPDYVRRILKLGPERTFGYELHVKRNTPGKAPFHVFVTPAQKMPMGYFPRSPQPVDLGPENTVEFVLLENRQSHLRLIERFRILEDGAALTSSAGESVAEPRAPGGTPLQLTAPKLFRGPELLKLARDGSTVRGSMVWVYVPGKGRFWFATSQSAQFRGSGRVQEKRLEFEWDGTRYALECVKPIVDLPGPWVVWVRLEEGWKPDPKDFLGSPIDPVRLYIGAIGG